MGLINDKETAGIDRKNDAGEMYSVNSGSATNITTATNTFVKNSPGVLKKMLINSHTSGSFKMYDGSATSTLTAIGGTYTPAAGSSVIVIEAEFTKGIMIATAGTLDFTALSK